MPPTRPSTLDHKSQAPCKDLTGLVKKPDTDNYFAYGGYSDVYIGIIADESGKEIKVAVKTFRNIHSSLKAEKHRTRLNRETWVWYTMDHQNILRFYGTINDPDFSPFPALVSPLCENGPARDYLSKHPDANLSKFVLGMAKGIEYLHQNNVIHGDIKGNNVLVDDDGNPLLCDFGRSKFLDCRGFTTDVRGAIRYMAPELFISESNKLTKETDIYGFAMLGVEVLTKQVPYHGWNDTKVLLSVQKGGRPKKPESETLGDLDAVWSLFEECWPQAPADRLCIQDVVKRMENIVSEISK